MKTIKSLAIRTIWTGLWVLTILSIGMMIAWRMTIM